ncbi:MAG: hypothetical protein C5B59_01785 [Bacteroidetes bacterium]|nr:MAG: hypothetical protein C5B59_01785 [Bacteroidota bacterium]
MKHDEHLLDLIKNKFPRQNFRIEKLYEESEDFRNLCKDYLTCVQTMGKYRESIEKEGRTVKEYEDILSELEKELYDFLFP